MGSPGFFSFVFHSLPLTSADHHISASNFRIKQTISDEWFAFHGPPKVADSLPDNKIVQGLSNFNSFHGLTMIRTTPKDTEIEQKSRHMVLPWALLQHGMCSHSSSHSVPGQGEQLQDLLPHPSCPQITQHWHHMQKKHSVCRTAAPSSSWEAFGTVRCLEAGFRQLQP